MHLATHEPSSNHTFSSRPGSIQTVKQERTIAAYSDFIHKSRIYFALTSKGDTPCTMEDLLLRQSAALGGSRVRHL